MCDPSGECIKLLAEPLLPDGFEMKKFLLLLRLGPQLQPAFSLKQETSGDCLPEGRGGWLATCTPSF